MKSHSLRIKTPEGIEFSLPLAGPIPRLVAWLIDRAALLVAFSVTSTLLAFFSLLSPDLHQALTILAFFLISLLYNILLEWGWQGQTLGKKVMRLRVIDSSGFRLRPDQVIVRNLLRVVDALPLLYGVGGAAALLHRHGQRLGDMAAGTVVIHRERQSFSLQNGVESLKYNSLNAYPHLMSRLRQRLSKEEIALGVDAITRREVFEPSSRVEVFHRLAEHYRERVSFPEESVDGLADEAYVRAVIDGILQPGRSQPKRLPSTED